MNISPNERFLPRSLLCIRNYSPKKFLCDLIAGITVGLVALPLAMAFAISSGVPPQSGLYCAIVAGFLISALGGSKTQIGGPTGAFVVVVAGIVNQYGMNGLFTCTMMAGVFLIILGVTGFGTAVKYIPRPVVIGFTNGIAVLIVSTQVKDFFGLQINKVPGDFIGRMHAIFSNFQSFSSTTAIVSLLALSTIIILKILLPKIPATIVALIAGTAAAWILELPLETIGTRFGGIPDTLPAFSIPEFRFDLILPLLSPAFTVTMLCAIESLLSAVVADRMTKDKHNPNVELFAQGVANIASPLFGGIPATGAIARTATNVRSGASTPVAGMIHAVTLLLIVLYAAPLANHIPLCILAAILMVVAYNMGEWFEIPEILRLSISSIVVWAITFLLTVFADLTVAVEAGMIMAALLYIRKVTSTTTVVQITKEYIEQGLAHSLQNHEIPGGISIFSIQGPFLFGAIDKLSLIEDKLDQLENIVILRLREMTAIDATGLHAIESLAEKLLESKKILILCGMREQPAKFTANSSLANHLGKENIRISLEDALLRAREINPNL